MRKAGGKPPAFFSFGPVRYLLPGGAVLAGPTVMVNLLKFNGYVGRGRRSRHPAICWARKRRPDGSLSLRERVRVRGSTAVWLFMLSVASAHITLPVSLLRYVSYGAGSAQWAASRRRPLYPRAPASKIATSWYLRLITAGFGSGRGSVPAKHGPQPASMRAAPACRERLSDFEAASTGSFSDP